MVGRISVKKRLKNTMLMSIFVILVLIIRIGYIQFVKGEQLKKLAFEQQTLDRKVAPNRGIIYDATGQNVLAKSITVYAVTVNPNRIKNKEEVTRKLADFFNLNYEETFKKINKRVSIVNIAKKIDKDKAKKLEKWINENNYNDCINIDEDTKRIYPYNNLASQVIGFCGSDNQGLNGIEAQYDDILQGVNGKVSKVTDATGKRIKNTSESYQSPVDGNDIILTIDANIQGIAEKYLKQACIDNNCEDGGNVIIMNPQNGDILAMCGYPNYNLNNPFEGNKDELQKLWRNKAISDTYEPGSTFKIVTASTALQENITTVDKQGEFCCVGHIEVSGVRMKCWRYYKPHGSESLRMALMNSCNPVFIGLGEKIGVKKYYEYLNKFGFFRKNRN